jgi:predicted signal transduction protein with EAL and GGDEF domain
VIDNVLLMVNAFTEILFDFRMVERFGTVYVCAQWSPFFIIHWVGCIIIAALIASVLFQKARQVAEIYRGRYIIGSLTFTLWLVLEMATRLISDNMNMWSISLVTIGIICFYFMYFLYPMMRIERMKTFAINNMSDPVLMFDYNNNLQVFNDAAEKMLGVSAYLPMEKYIADNELYYTVEEKVKGKSKNREFTRTKLIGGKTYLIHGQELWDEKDKFVGTLVVYTDISNQERLKDEATLYATRDQLTGLWNRDYFFEMASKTIRENPDVEFAMVVSDIYQFKMFNEILGYNTGDDLLLAVAQGFRPGKHIQANLG